MRKQPVSREKKSYIVIQVKINELIYRNNDHQSKCFHRLGILPSKMETDIFKHLGCLTHLGSL